MISKEGALQVSEATAQPASNVAAILRNQKKSILGIAISVVLLAVFALFPPPEGMSRVGMNSIGIFLAAIALWITEAFPVCVSALGLIALLPLFGVMTYGDAMGSFGTGTAFFIMATSGITVALVNSSIPMRITAWIVRKTKGRAWLIIMGFGIASGILSAIMSSLATCALFCGLVLVMLKTSGELPGKSKLGRALMIALPVCCGIGGFITPAGTPGNILMMELMEGYGIHMNFAKWTAVGAPFGMIALLISTLWLSVVFKPDDVGEEAKQLIKTEYEKLGKWTAYEKKAVVIIAAMLVCWFLGSWIPFLNTTTVAILGLIVMFLPGVDLLTWKSFNSECNWNLVLIMGTATILMKGVTETGAMEWIVNQLFSNLTSMNPILMWIVLAIIVCVIRALIPTTTAVIALFAPMLYGVAQMTGANTTAMLLIPAFWGPAAMLMIYTEPIFLITYGEKYYTEGNLLKFGWLPSLLLAVIIGLLFPLYLPMLGF